MEIFVDNVIAMDSLHRNVSRTQNYYGIAASEHDVLFRDELLKRMSGLVIERSIMEMQAQFAPVISTDRMSHIMADNNISRLRVRDRA